MKSNKGFTLIELLIVVAIIGIIAAIAIPGLLRARQSGNEASGIGSMRSTNSAQATYAASCGSGFYAPSYPDLGRAPVGGTPFIGPDLGLVAAPVKSTYTMALLGTVAGGSPASCNAVAAGASTSGYRATASPADTSMRFFATNTSGTVFFALAAVPAVTDTDCPACTPLQ